VSSNQNRVFSLAVAEAAEPVVTKITIERAVWFYDLRLAQLADGGYQLCVAETTVDDNEPQLPSRDILDERVATIDDALARLRLVLTSAG
jgi:hypothetical protein